VQEQEEEDHHRFRCRPARRRPSLGASLSHVTRLSTAQTSTGRDKWHGCTRGLSDFKTLGRFLLPILPLGLNPDRFRSIGAPAISHAGPMWPRIAAPVYRQQGYSTLQHIKAFLSGVFRYAERMGVIQTENPFRDAVLPEAKPSEDTYAYYYRLGLSAGAFRSYSTHCCDVQPSLVAGFHGDLPEDDAACRVCNGGVEVEVLTPRRNTLSFLD
jgi:hypothetical protein